MLRYLFVLILSASLVFSSVIRLNVNNEIETTATSTHNQEEGDLFEGDIAGVKLVDDNKGAAQIVTTKRGKWPNGVVPFVIDDVYNETLVNFIRSGMELIENATRVDGKDCIKFIPRTTEQTYIRVINDTGCYSYIGMQLTPGVQVISLKAPGCMVKGTIAHEFIHALGFWHEQSRPDRDEYIEIVWNKITEANKHNFNKYSTDLVDTLELPYDYGSVMHYNEKSFSIDGNKTILVKKAGATIGQRVDLSANDALEIQKYYGCI